MKSLRTLGRRSAVLAKSISDQVLGSLVALTLRIIRHLDWMWISNVFARIARTIGPWTKEHRIGRANLAAAYPEKSPEEIERILAGVWDNLGRVVAEFAHLDRLIEGNPEKRLYFDYAPGSAERFKRVRDDGKPALVFAAHIGNLEMPALVAQADGMDALVLYRRPNVGAVAEAIMASRQSSMGTLVPTDMNAPIRLARALEANRHVAILVDQHYVKGVDVTFFGRRCKANPLIAALARHVECEIHGTRVIRVPGGRFLGEITEPIPPVRDAEDKIDIQGTMQAITNVVEGWVREHPDQWLWLHRRWRE